MLTLIFANIGYIITGLSLFTIGGCLYSKTDNMVWICFLLGAYTSVAWIPSFWSDPHHMAQIHTIIVMLALVAIRGKYGNSMVTILVMALAADVSFAYLQGANVGITPTNLFYWQSILNILTIALCIITLFRCYNETTKKMGFGERHSFYAKSSIETSSGIFKYL